MQIFKWVPAKVEETPLPTEKQMSGLVNNNTEQDSITVNLQPKSPEISITSASKQQNGDHQTNSTPTTTSARDETDAMFDDDNSRKSSSANGVLPQANGITNKENISEIDSCSNSQNYDPESQPNSTAVVSEQTQTVTPQTDNNNDITSAKQNSSTSDNPNKTENDDQEPPVAHDGTDEKLGSSAAIPKETDEPQSNKDSSDKVQVEKRSADKDSNDGPPTKQPKLDEGVEQDKA